jgi:hypothetical protein
MAMPKDEIVSQQSHQPPGCPVQQGNASYRPTNPQRVTGFDHATPQSCEPPAPTGPSTNHMVEISSVKRLRPNRTERHLPWLLAHLEVGCPARVALVLGAAGPPPQVLRSANHESLDSSQDRKHAAPRPSGQRHRSNSRPPVGPVRSSPIDRRLDGLASCALCQSSPRGGCGAGEIPHT